MYCVFDAASLRFVRSHDGTTLSVRSATGERLAECAVQGSDRREHALAGLDAVLASGKVLRPSLEDPARRAKVRVAIYNPYTAQVAVAPLPDTVTLGDFEPLALPLAGLVGAFDDEAQTLSLGLRSLHVIDARRSQLATLHDAHNATAADI